MEPMDWLNDEELLRFFRRCKTEMSCMEKPHTFLCQLRDYELVPEDRYKKVIRMKSKDNIRKGLYEILDWLERERPQSVREFWSCVFKDTIHYPTLKLLRNSLLDGSFHFDKQPEETVETEKSDEGKRKALSGGEEGEEKQENSVKMKKKRILRSSDDDEEPAGPSSQSIPRKKKSKKICFSSPLKKGEKNHIWSWPIYKLQLPVTCGDQAGTLNRNLLAKGEKCIVVGKRWFTPSEFESFAGKKSSRNWKASIRCQDTQLGKLIQEGHLKTGTYKGGCRKANRSLFPSGHATAVSDEDEEAGEEEEEEGDDEEEKEEGEEEEGDEEEEEGRELNEGDRSRESSAAVAGEAVRNRTEQPEVARKVFRVTCRGAAGTLHAKRFSSGTCGKSIRTETSWMTPVEFLKVASCPADASWKKEIRCEEEPLSVLIEANDLTIDSLLCKCSRCKPDGTELENQKNDDECGVCRREDEDKLVMCDDCPRSFHQKCHLPHVEDVDLGVDSPWMCTFCIFRIYQGCFYQELEREAAVSLPISQHMLECQYLLLYLCTADEEQTFSVDPRLYLNDYCSVIKTPMWLGHIAHRLQKPRNRIVGEFETDVQLIFSNCALYNRDNAEILATGNRLKELFDREFKSVFNIKE
ncbi:nuclear body protein SP140-like protein isoform X3 [Pseudoliparis swirei]|uniref:nuclear body protein SP140-like protein isoform X3 n=1 Tax=Pseudoliparis swirei TaxID=2059687 RepID=UPI0024BED7C6|nr:nuclear body protein SP140-like protein isoform X3 [Pseudoliparis swirei]